MWCVCCWLLIFFLLWPVETCISNMKVQCMSGISPPYCLWKSDLRVAFLLQMKVCMQREVCRGSSSRMRVATSMSHGWKTVGCSFKIERKLLNTFVL